MNKRTVIMSCALAALVMAALVWNALWPEPVEHTGFNVMGSMLQETIYCRKPAKLKALSAIFVRMKVLEQSIGDDQRIIDLGEKISEQSGSAFSLRLGALVKLWDINGDPRVPTQAAIDEALRKDDLDFGAIGKGAACDAALEQLQKEKGNVTGAVINLGGNILTYGQKPWGKPFQIALRDPKGGPNDTIGMFTLRGTHFISTSGSYEKYFEQDGKRYHHIFDPATGYPAETGGLISVTVISENGALGDALSTACFVLGYAKSLALLESYGCDAIFIYEDGNFRMVGGVDQYFKYFYKV